VFTNEFTLTFLLSSGWNATLLVLEIDKGPLAVRNLFDGLK
jgi:hypothetical protein